MSDAIKHECGIALVRLKALTILQRQVRNRFGLNKMYLLWKTAQSRSRWPD